MATPRIQPKSALPGTDDRQVPASALVVSVLALAVAGAVNFIWPSALPDYFSLVWLLALVPPFLLAYHKGWEGAALALAAGMVLLVGVEVGGSLLADREIRWWVVGGVIVLLIFVSLGAGSMAERLHRRHDDALRLAYADPLTNLPNRRILDMFLFKEFAAAQRGGTLSVVIFDVDDFKAFNDREGHSAGDEALRTVARVLDHNTRAEDLSGRLAGDEFLTLLPDEGLQGAWTFARRVRRAAEGARFGRDHRVTVSVGVAGFDPTMAMPKELVDAADRALYAAKRRGGNRVVVNAELGAPDAGPAEEDALFLDADGTVAPGPRPSDAEPRADAPPSDAGARGDADSEPSTSGPSPAPPEPSPAPPSSPRNPPTSPPSPPRTGPAPPPPEAPSG